MTLNPSPALTVRDLDGLLPNADQPGKGVAAAYVALINKTDEVLSTVSGLAAMGLNAVVVPTPAAESANAIDVACQITDFDGAVLAAARNVVVETLAVTDGQGDLAAATAAVGTVVKAQNPATGANLLWMETEADGTFSFKVSNTAAEKTIVRITGEGLVPYVLVLDFSLV